MNKEEKLFKLYEIAIRTRDFEITNFWKRSLFFAAFVSVVFAAYQNTQPDQPGLTTIILSITGTLLSLVWCFVNRGSKYWYESWEIKVKYIEKEMGINLFRCWVRPDEKGCPLYRGRFRSVSKLAIYVSDLILVVWCLLTFKTSWKFWGLPTSGIWFKQASWIFLLLGLLPIVVLLLDDTKTNGVKKVLGDKAKGKIVEESDACVEPSELRLY